MSRSLNEQGLSQLDEINQFVSQWVIHVGGTQNNNYTTRLNIPLYVIAFGILVGYLRYLYETYEKRGHHHEEDKDADTQGKTAYQKKTHHENTADDFLHNTLSELAEVLLAPLLAVAVWFILFQGDLSGNPYIAAAIVLLWV